MLIKKQNPVRYDLCCQTVTIYHKEGTGYTRKEYKNAFLSFQDSQSITKTGQQGQKSFLLVIPGDEQKVFAGDKIFNGIGPEIDTREAWAKFLPDAVPGLVVAKTAEPCFWAGRIVHTEATG